MPDSVLPDEAGKEKNPAKSVIDSPKPKEPLKLRAFGDAVATRQAIYDNVLKSAQSIGPVANVRNTLTLENVKYADPEHISLQKQKEAVLSGKSLYRRLRGTWRLRDNETGKLLDEQHLTVAQVPYQTNRGTFIMNGSDYILRHQMRLNPGVFTRIKENGELEAHINVLPGKGVSHRYFLEPETGVFKINIGQAKLPLIPVLRAMGVTDKQLKEHWGSEILQANAAADDKRVIDKLYGRLVRRGDPAAEHPIKSKAVADTISKMELDPEVTERTLGFPHKNITPEAILATTKKLIHVSRGDVDPDDRDHLAFQTLYGPEDLLGERFAKDKSFLRQLLWRATTKGNLSHVQPGALTKQLHAALLHSGLGQAAEEINPGELLDAQTSVTRLGEGGIPNMEAVPDESRSVQPSHFAFIDPIRTPECHDQSSEVMTRSGWKPWPKVSKEEELACLIDGRLEYYKPEQLYAAPYRGTMYGARTKMLDYLVTPNHRMFVRPYDNAVLAWRIEEAERTHGRPRKFMCGGHLPFVGTQRDFFVLPTIERLGNNTNTYQPIPFSEWAEFMGWFLSEGHTSCVKDKGQYTVGISQSKTANPGKYALIELLLNRLPFSWHYNHSMHCYILSGKQLALYLASFGFCHEKWIPDELLDCQLDARHALFNTMLLGDGRRNKKGELYQYCTTSPRLAVDFQRLAFSLGISSKITVEQDKRKDTYLEVHVVHLHEINERVLIKRNYYTEEYDGNVYCATVPGGLLYVRRGNGCGYWSGNSFKVGVDTRLASAARKGNDGRIYAPFINVKTGKQTHLSPQDLTNKVIAFPGEMAKNTPYVSAQAAGATRFVPREDVDYELPHFENAFSPLGNMIPMKSAIKGQRMAMGSRYLAQALPLVARESPHVQGAVPGTGGKTSYEEHFAEHLGAVRAQQHGRVTKITPDEITVKYADGTTHKHELYNNFPYARKTFIHNEPVINVGDPIKPGQLLAKSNFTDDTGAAALGLNARIAFVPMAGANYEDAAVISESMRKRLASEHMYQHDQEWTDRHAKGKKGYISMFPGVYDRKILDKMDHKGVVMPGTEVKFGDPLILAAEAREISHSKVHRGRKASYSDKTQTWEHHSPGVVTDVVHSGNNTTVAVKSINDINVGDKLSNRYGGKGVVSMILPDDKMPHDGQGKPYELLLNPLGMISRINPAQIAEAVLGKITAKTGKKYKVEDFGSVDDLIKFAHDEAQKYGVKDKEPVFDPKTGRQIKDPFTGEDPLSGYQFMLKLHHMAESKGQGRGTGAYTSEEVPAKGGAEGSKRIALLETNALLSHGATEVLRDAHLIRGQKNDQYWQAYMSGFRPPEPQVPFVYRKFLHHLQAAGINPVREGGRMHIMSLTDRDVNQMAGDREIQNSDTVDWKEGLKPRKGGLFDPTLTGGHNGTRWSYIKLHEPLPNPAFEEPIRRMLGLTQNRLEGIIGGTDQINGQTGPKAIWNALDQMDVKKEINRARAEIKSGRATARDAAVRRLGYLKTLDRLDMHPRDWVVTKVPVLPPAFRPVSTMAGSGTQLVSDPNYLYKEVLDANDVLKQLHGKVDDLSQERLNLYNAFKGAVGLGDPIQPKNQERRVQGILKHVFGSSPKLGTVQRQLLGATVDVVGRAVITPNPDFDMDQVGLPETKAWSVYQPFVIRRLVQKGVSRLEAVQAVKDKKEMAKQAIVEEMRERPVIISRAPVLHKFGIQAFWPKLIKGDVMQISPLVTKGFNADFDGDMMNWHVPASEEAKREAVEKMLPSRNLFSTADFQVHYLPGQEYVGGLYTASAARDDAVRRPRVFATKKDAIAAYNRGEIDVQTPVEIIQH